ncbi:hypothetical protein L0152_01290 [bacterium]|nr:hypothetical protein [bacterium]
MRKKLGTALLLLTLTCGVAGADNFSPGYRQDKAHVTFMQQIHQAWNHLFSWF